jgi:acetolactate synthase I/II/III large subunit
MQHTQTNADVVLVLECDVPWVPGPKAPSAEAWMCTIDVDPIKHRRS